MAFKIRGKVSAMRKTSQIDECGRCTMHFGDTRVDICAVCKSGSLFIDEIDSISPKREKASLLLPFPSSLLLERREENNVLLFFVGSGCYCI